MSEIHFEDGGCSVKGCMSVICSWWCFFCVPPRGGLRREKS